MPALRLLIAGTLCLALLAPWPGNAHPEDEFCVPGETGLDPALCEALSSLDSPTDAPPELAPLLDAAGQERGFWATAGLYVTIGVRHILPGGLDHILFVLALFLASNSLRELLLQISAFTVAHTATLGLAAAGVIAPPAALVEPLIAASIAFVAFENIALPALSRWRLLVVFLFGLVHGLGFAGFIGELGLPAGQFWSGLLGFNVGVELGQLGVVFAAVLLAGFLRPRIAAIRAPADWRRRVVVPASLAIGLTGAYWTIERIAGTVA